MSAVSPILTEHSRWERRLVAEEGPCAHKNSRVLDAITGGADGFAMHYMRCDGCGYLFTATKWAGRDELEVEPMTPAAAARYTRIIK